MKFTDLGIDGFGVWSGLEMRDLSPGLNVFYGPNEAGKTTLLQFIRGVLYGFSPDRRRRYLPPVHGGQAGGWLALSTLKESFDIARADRSDSLFGETIVTASDGTVQGDAQLRDLLGDVDEAIFQNVFAVGLEELQNLGTLDGTEAARLLYGLSAGMDRVSLAEAMRELDVSRRRLLADDDAKSQIGELLREREQLSREIDDLAEATNRYWRLGAEREASAAEIAEAEADALRRDRHSRTLELARSLAPKWDERAALDEHLAAIGPLADFPRNAMERIERIAASIRRHRRRLARIKARCIELKTATSALSVRESLWRLAPRIESLAENESWIASVEQEFGAARQAVEQFEARMSAGRDTLGLAPQSDTNPAPDLSPRRLTALRAPATELRRAMRAAREAKSLVRVAEQEAESQAQSVTSALAGHGVTELNPALERAGQAASQWRRRVQLDDRLERMARHHADLEEETHASLERQMLPAWMLASLGAVFVVGVLLVFAGWLLPGSFIGTLGWLLSLLGIAALGTAAGAKWALERSAARRLESCQKQLVVLESQTRQLQDERTALDKQLPSGGTPTARLKAAEADLAALEEVLPLEAKRQAAEQQLPLARGEAERAKDKLRAAHRQWQAALAAAHFPKNVSPKQLRQFSRKRAGLADLSRQHAAAQQQRERIERELAALTARIEPLFAESGLTPQGDSPSQRIRQLGRELAEEQARAGRRDALLADLKKLAHARKKHRASVVRLRRRRTALLKRAGVANRAELVRRAAERASADDLARRRDLLDRELAAACAGVCRPEELAALLEEPNRQQLANAPQAPSESSHSPRDALHALLETRGRLANEMDSLLDDRRLGAKQLRLASLDARLASAIERWQVIAITLRILQQIKEEYERKGQPETLRAASEYLARLTGSRYARVWTPLGENSLLVDDAGGTSLAVEVLSRGTREQLYLALRLALVDVYARRGVEMPLVLDDVLVNFDDGRSERAAELLCDFAAAGHQLLVFTCHERLAGVFQSLGTPVRRLPANTEPRQAVEAIADRQPRLERPAQIEPQSPAEDSLLQPPRRRRTKAARSASERENSPPPEPASNGTENGHAPAPATPQDALPAAAVELPPPASTDAAPRAAARQRRSDPPHRVLRARTVRRRWSAEEFDGELEDRVREPDVGDIESAREKPNDAAERM